MYRVPLALVSVGLMLGGCVAAGPCDYNPASCYPPPQPYAVYPQAGPQAGPQAEPYGYPSGPPPGQAYYGSDGLTYVDGYPVEVIDNRQVELVFVPTLGGWGYYDGDRQWRGAPPDMRDRLERFHPGGQGMPPPGGFRPGGGPGPAQDRVMGRPGYGGGPPAAPSRQGYPGPGSYGGNRPGGFQGQPRQGQAPQGQAPEGQAPEGQAPQGRPPQGPQSQGQQFQGQQFQGRAPGGPAPERREPPRDRECQRGQQRC